VVLGGICVMIKHFEHLDLIFFFFLPSVHEAKVGTCWPFLPKMPILAIIFWVPLKNGFSYSNNKTDKQENSLQVFYNHISKISTTFKNFNMHLELQPQH
jgi:hypothetical protein